MILSFNDQISPVPLEFIVCQVQHVEIIRGMPSRTYASLKHTSQIHKLKLISNDTTKTLKILPKKKSLFSKATALS